eukprot:1057441-Prorocentrum_minimum.AAC.1
MALLGYVHRRTSQGFDPRCPVSNTSEYFQVCVEHLSCKGKYAHRDLFVAPRRRKMWVWVRLPFFNPRLPGYNTEYLPVGVALCGDRSAVAGRHRGARMGPGHVARKDGGLPHRKNGEWKGRPGGGRGTRLLGDGHKQKLPLPFHPGLGSGHRQRPEVVPRRCAPRGSRGGPEG